MFSVVPLLPTSNQIKNWEPLSDEWTPSPPLFRDNELEQIRNGLSIPGNHLYLYGARGLGKTLIARVVKQDFEAKGYRTEYVSCGRSSKTTFRGIVPDKQDYANYFAAMAKKPSLLIFDDISAMYLKSTISYWLHDIHDAAVKHKTTFNLHVIVTSTIPLLVYLGRNYISDFTQSRLGFKTVTFNQYTPDQIQTILGQRIDAALKNPEMVAKDALTWLSVKAARLGSDMRFATRVLKGAISQALLRATDVNCDVMEASYAYEWRDFYKSQYLSMPPHKAYLLHTVFWILLKDKQCSSTLAYHTYAAACNKYGIKPMRERMLRIYLDEMEDERFIDLEKTHVRRGRLTKITSAFDPAEMVSAVEDLDWRSVLR